MERRSVSVADREGWPSWPPVILVRPTCGAARASTRALLGPFGRIAVGDVLSGVPCPACGARDCDVTVEAIHAAERALPAVATPETRA